MPRVRQKSVHAKPLKPLKQRPQPVNTAVENDWPRAKPGSRKEPVRSSTCLHGLSGPSIYHSVSHGLNVTYNFGKNKKKDEKPSILRQKQRFVGKFFSILLIIFTNFSRGCPFDLLSIRPCSEPALNEVEGTGL